MRSVLTAVILFVLFTVALAAIATEPGHSNSAELFDQPPDPGIYAGISSNLTYDGTIPGRRTADDFVLPAGGRINEIIWWGQHAPSSSVQDKYTVTFYADASGLPGAVLLEGRGRVVLKSHTSIPALTEYRVILCHELSAQPGVRYWISIFNEGHGAAWRWNNSPTGNNVSVQALTTPKSTWKQVSGEKVDASFQLGTASLSIWDKLKCNFTFLALSLVTALAAIALLWKRAHAST